MLNGQPLTESSQESVADPENFEKAVEKVSTENAAFDSFDAQEEEVADHWEDLSVDEPTKDLKPTSAVQQASVPSTAERHEKVH